MKYVALKELPQGHQPGETFEATEAEGDVLILVGAAHRADPDPPERTTRRRYHRADLEAES